MFPASRLPNPLFLKNGFLLYICLKAPPPSQDI
jgi:hypothetical protein